jgi:hypothetical protein
MLRRSKTLLILLAGASVLMLSVLSSGADGLLSRAAAQLREKDYGEAYQLARKTDESPQRSFLLGVAALRLGRAEDALVFLTEAEQNCPGCRLCCFLLIGSPAQLKKFLRRR